MKKQMQRIQAKKNLVNLLFEKYRFSSKGQQGYKPVIAVAGNMSERLFLGLCLADGAVPSLGVHLPKSFQITVP